MGASAVPVRGRMTVEEFYQIPGSERKFFELVDGELVRTPMAHIPGESTRENLIFAIAGYPQPGPYRTCPRGTRLPVQRHHPQTRSLLYPKRALDSAH
jgi:Uma2 family endonuclease